MNDQEGVGPGTVETACAKVETSTAHAKTASRLCWSVSREVLEDEEGAGSQITKSPVLGIELWSLFYRKWGVIERF